jgi:hypothetical protein
LAFAGLLAATVFLVLAIVQAQATAAASGGFSFDGGSPRERLTVRSALEASEFDWNVIAGHVTVHIKAGGCYAGRGQIWLDPQMLAHRREAWGVIQHEFAHQVDYFLLDDRTRRKLTRLLGAKAWSPGGRIYPHGEYGAERFASTLAWAYWPSARNSIYRRAHAEATAMPVLKFRRLMGALIGSQAGRGATKDAA